MNWKVGDEAIAMFKRSDGTWYTARGVIERIWGKVPYAVTFIEATGPIRVPIGELYRIPRKVNLDLPAVCSPGRSRNAGRRKPGSSGDRVHETKAGKI